MPPLLPACQNSAIEQSSKPAVRKWEVADEAAMRRLGEKIVEGFKSGDVVFLEGELGAGKTTLVRGMLHGLGWKDDVRSPTFNLMHEYPTLPPVLHADLYRVANWQGIGIEDYLDTHICLIEWPDRAKGLEDSAFRITIGFSPHGREVRLEVP